MIKFKEEFKSMLKKLHQKRCVPCEGGTKPLEREEFAKYLEEIIGWEVKNDKLIEKTFQFNDFKGALNFINKVGEIAEKEGHHPDISIFNFNKARISFHTHAIGGLSENDFIMASKIDQLFNNSKPPFR